MQVLFFLSVLLLDIRLKTLSASGLSGGLSHLQLLSDGGIGCVITVDRSILLSLEKYIRNLALGTVDQPLARILMDQLLARSFGFVDQSLVRSFSRGEAMED